MAESSGILTVNDEILEVNGIEVAGKDLDQVIDVIAMVAESRYNLIIMLKKLANQEIQTALFRNTRFAPNLIA